MWWRMELSRENLKVLLIMVIFERLISSSLARANMFKNVCLGGTFDGIHSGHKLLFAEATRLCKERLVVGVTDTNMIQNKTLWELIRPVEERVQNVKDYLNSINPNLTYQIVPIQDLYGPTIVDKDLECIVVSDETVKGAHIINAKRLEMGWPKLEINVIRLLQDSNDCNDRLAMERLNEKKVSSSCMRVEKLGRILRPPEPNRSIPDRPYLIGLTGGIASGKTTIGKYLESLGFGYINYDLLGHKTYESPDSDIYKQIVDHFGSDIIDPETRQIIRSKLAKIVFGDRTQLDKLNEMVWPGIYKLVDKEIENIKHKHDVIVLESALLIESGQTQRVHQVWTSIIPPKEAIKRQVESRGLSEEEAERRVKSQIDNLTRIQKSNVVFCSLWDQDFTRQQVQRCVKELREKYLA